MLIFLKEKYQGSYLSGYPSSNMEALLQLPDLRYIMGWEDCGSLWVKGIHSTWAEKNSPSSPFNFTSSKVLLLKQVPGLIAQIQRGGVGQN